MNADPSALTSEGGPATGDRPALRRCTTIEPGEFAQRIWGREASLSRAVDLPADFADLFSLSAADQLLSQQGMRTPFLRVARDGSTLPAARFTSGGGVGATVSDQVSDVKLASLFAQGSTIVLQALHRTHGPVISFAQDLGAELGHPVQVNAYLTPPQSQGFSSHYDVHDVFVLQIAGEKRWRIHAPVHPSPLRDQPWTGHRAAVEEAAAGEPLIDEVLRPGDALYLPRGYLHAATALGEMTAHLTVGIHVWTRRHLLEQLLAATGDVEDLRTSLPLGVDVTSPDSLQAELAATVSSFTDRVGSIGAGQIAALLTPGALATSKAEPLGPLAQAAAAARVSIGDKVRWRHALRAVITVDGDQLQVRTTDGIVRLPISARAGVERLQRGEVLAVAELDAGSDDARVALARTLLSSSLVVPT